MIIQTMPYPAAAGLSNATTFSPNYKRSGATLSNGNLTITGAGTGYNSACSIDAKSSGRWYFEMTVGAGFDIATDEIGVGVIDYRHKISTFVNDSPTSQFPGAQCSTFRNIRAFSNATGTQAGTLPGTAIAAGDVICVDFDADADTIRFRQNGGTWSTAVDISSTTDHPKFPFVYVSSISATFNFGATAFAYSVPSGASGWTTNAAYEGTHWRYFFRENIYSGSPNPNINVAEMELRLTSGGADQTGSATMTASSTAGTGFEASKAVDNNATTKWVCANNAGNDSWLQAAFGSAQAFKQAVLQIRNDLPATNWPSKFQTLYGNGTIFYPAAWDEPTYTSQGESQTFALCDG